METDIEKFGVALGKALNDVFRKFEKAIKQVTEAIVAMLGAVTTAMVESYAIEKMGVTEVDIRRIDFSKREVVLWNRRRLPFVIADVHEWWRQLS